MSRFNTGIIYTTDRCIGCNKCVSSCPSMGANISLSQLQNMEIPSHIEVNDKKCTHCGLCLSSCNRGARSYKDDTDRLFADLENGEQIALLVDPTISFILGKKANNLLGYLTLCGISGIYDVSFGADICIWAHAKYLKDNTVNGIYPQAYFAATCPAFISTLQHCKPEMLKNVIPVQTPAMCTATYVRKYLKKDVKFAYLSTCVSQYDDIHDVPEAGIEYSITLSHLQKKLANENLDLYYAKADLTTATPGRLYGFPGAFKDNVALFFPRSDVLTIYHNIEIIINHNNTKNDTPGINAHPLMSSISPCNMGCLCGPAGPSANMSRVYYSSYTEAREAAFSLIDTSKSYEQLYEDICERFRELNPEDFARHFESKFRQPFSVPDATIDSIFREMHKDTPTKRTINCRACGYNSCREMAIAVAHGYAKTGSCVHYVNDDLLARSFRDGLTGLLNTGGFLRFCKNKLRWDGETTYVVAFCNINRLGNINELYGDEIGTAVICKIGEEACRIFGEQSIVARLGGGNFALCFEYTGENMEKLESLRYFNFPELGLNAAITWRCGMAFCNESENVMASLNKASFASNKCTDLYQNSYLLFNDEMLKEWDEEAKITSEMHHAMENNEFVLYLQPQYHHESGVMTGAEALCRWAKPDGTIISPAVFIPIFEKNGYVRTLDKYIWESIFRQIRKWMDEGKPMVPISANISRISLVDDEIIQTITALQDKYNIDKSYLHFEITESAYVSGANEYSFSQRIQRIRSLGYMIAMDDFGSGYSSLNSLKNLPIDILKLDMGFFRGDEDLDKSKTIITHIVQMGRELGYDLIAEGVEAKEQADFLDECGCDIIQGYLYAKPLPIAKFEELME